MDVTSFTEIWRKLCLTALWPCTKIVGRRTIDWWQNLLPQGGETQLTHVPFGSLYYCSSLSAPGTSIAAVKSNLGGVQTVDAGFCKDSCAVYLSRCRIVSVGVGAEDTLNLERFSWLLECVKLLSRRAVWFTCFWFRGSTGTATLSTVSILYRDSN
jgi:hypothetical protein